MKKILLITTVSALVWVQALCQEQKKLTVNLRPGKHDVIYLDFDPEKKQLVYLIRRVDVDAGKNVHSESNQINIFFKWLNPLKYKRAWADEFADDPREVEIKEFLGIYLSPFGVTPQSDKAEGSKALENANVPGGGISKMPVLEGFHNADLNDLYIQLKTHENLIGNGMTALEKLTNAIVILDGLHDSAPFKEKTGAAFAALYKVIDASEAKDVYSTQQGEMDKLPTVLENHTKAIQEVEALLKVTIIEDPLLNSMLHSKLKRFLVECNETVALGKALKAKIDPILMMFKKSMDKRSKLGNDSEEFLERSVTFADGKILKSKLTIKETKFDLEKMELLDESEIYANDFVFQRYEPVKFSMSTGIFYSRTSIIGYGIADNNGIQTVVQDDVPSKQAVTALFGNFMFDLFKSRYFVPLVQLGADPTKKRPFVLAGGGFAIPAAKLALTGGAIWTWIPSLKTLKVDGPVSSTLDLEKDLKYEFDPGPQGFYLGLQYNF